MINSILKEAFTLGHTGPSALAQKQDRRSCPNLGAQCRL